MQTTTAKLVGPQDGKAGFPGSIGVRFMIDGEEAGGGFLWSSTRCRRARWPPHSTGTPARMSTATSLKGAWARCSATRSWSVVRGV